MRLRLCAVLFVVSALALPGCLGADADGDLASADAAPTSADESPADGDDAAPDVTVDERPPAAGVSGGRDAVRETLVVVQPLETGPIKDEVVVSARVEADVSVQVFPKLVGLPITAIHFDEGETVNSGDVLMTLYDTELDIAAQRAEGTLAEKRKEVERQALMLQEQDARIVRTERAQRKQLEDLARLEGLVSDGLVNLQEVADARLESEQATDDLELARFARDAAEVAGDLAAIAEAQAELDWKRAQEDLSHTQVVSPVTGVVAERNVEVGELSSQGEPAFRVVDVSRPTLELRVPQDALARLAAGQRVAARSVTGASQTFAGVVRRVNPVLDRATGSVSVLVDLEPAPGLVPGLFCEARVVTASRDDALLVDKRAVRYDDDQPVFFALETSKEGVTTVRMVPFVAGASTATRIEVLSDVDGEPVPADLSVVVVGNENLKDGARVRVQEEPY